MQFFHTKCIIHTPDHKVRQNSGFQVYFWMIFIKFLGQQLGIWKQNDNAFESPDIWLLEAGMEKEEVMVENGHFNI